MEPIGFVVGTEQNPTTAYHFWFWAIVNSKLGIGSIVETVSEKQEKVYGIVVEAFAYNDVPTAMVDFLGRQGVPDDSAPTVRPEIRLFQAAVLRRIPDEPVSAVGISKVFLSDKPGVNHALGGEKFEGRGIPIGLYGSLEQPIPVFADPDFLIGPEAGHLNVTGTSGLAAKTSYIEFLLHSIFQKSAESVAAVVFNVKGGDLLFLDHEFGDDFSDIDRNMYAACDLAVSAFKNVQYWAPFADEARESVLSLRNHPDLNANPTRGFCYGLIEALNNIEILLNREDIDVKADAFLGHLRENVVGKKYAVNSNKTELVVTSLRELREILKDMIKEAEISGNGYYKSYSVQTIKKIYNRLDNLHIRFKGLITHQQDSLPPLPKEFQGGSVHVIDLSQTDSSAQDLVFAATISDLHERMETQKLGVKKLIVVVDELNKYAPSGGRETHLLNSLRDIAARGRYLGLVLFGAQQFRSRVDPQVVGNCANSAYGHIQLEELSSPNYSIYSQAVREKLATADPGKMMIRHPHFSQPIFVRFPRPCCMKGNDGLKKFKPQEIVSDREKLIRLAAEVSNGFVKRADVEEILETTLPSDIQNCILNGIRNLAGESNLSKERTIQILKSSGKKGLSQIKATTEVISDDEDPFAN